MQIFIKPAHLQFNKMTASNLSTIFATILLRSPQKEPTALLAGLTNELAFVEKLILTAPPLDVDQFPIFAVLNQPQKALPPTPASKQAAAITSFAFSPPTSPGSLTVSSTLGDVAYSTTTDPSCTSFEDMSSKDDKDSKDSKDSSKSEQISDFEEPDLDLEDSSKRDPHDSKTPRDDLQGKGEDPRDDTLDASGKNGGQRKLESSEELPEFVFVPTSHNSEG